MKLKTLFQYKISLTHIITSFYYLLFFITPLVMFSKTSEIFEFNKMMFIYLTTILIGFFYIVHLIFQKDRFYRHWIYIPLLAFLVSQFLSTVFSIDIHTSLFGYYGRWNGGLLSIVSYVILLTIFIQIFPKDKLHRFLLVGLASSLVVILWGIPGLVGHDVSCLLFAGEFTNGCWTSDFNPAVRMFSTIGQPNWLGAYLVIQLFIAFYFLKKQWYELKYRFIYASYVTLNIIALYFTKSRSAWLALVLSAVFISIVYLYTRFRSQISKKALITSITIAVVILTVLIWTIQKDFFTLPRETSQITDSSVIRKIVWRGAIDLANKYPLLGTGVETFAYAYNETRPAEHNLTSEWDFVYNKAHNEFLNYAATTGYIGLLTYLSVIVSTYIVLFALLLSSLKDQEDERTYFALALLGSYTSIQITNFFGFSVSTIQLFFYFIPAISIVYFLVRKKEELINYNKILSSTLTLRVSFLLLFLAAISSLTFIIRAHMADMLYAKGRYAQESDQNLPAVIYLTQALHLKYEHVYEDRLSSAYANVAYEQSLQKDTEAALDSITKSQQANLHTLQESPKNILYWRTKGKNYYMFYQITQNQNDLFEAARAMEKMIQIAPTDVQSRYTVALFYWIVSNELKDKNEASRYHLKSKEMIEQVLKLKPNYIEAKELLESL